MSKKTKYAQLVSITIQCPVLKKEVVIHNFSISGWEYSTEIMSDCGYDIIIDQCECGKHHVIKG